MRLLENHGYSNSGLFLTRNLDVSKGRTVIAYIIWLDRSEFPASRAVIAEAANGISAVKLEMNSIS